MIEKRVEMKKEEAMQLAPERSKLLCEYIIQILSDPEKVDGKITIDFAKINNERMVTFDIYVPSKDFEKHLNTGITTQQIDVLTGQILNDLVDNFMESETMGCTKYYTIRGGYGMNMNGINLVNTIGSKVKLNFAYRGDKFDEQIQDYNVRLDEYRKQQTDNGKLK